MSDMYGTEGGHGYSDQADGAVVSPQAQRSLNEFLASQGYRIYMCTLDQRYLSFVQEENYCVNVVCLYDERRQTSTRPQMQSFMDAHRERLDYGRGKDVHFLRLVCTTERGVGAIPPMADASARMPAGGVAGAPSQMTDTDAGMPAGAPSQMTETDAGIPAGGVAGGSSQQAEAAQWWQQDAGQMPQASWGADDMGASGGYDPWVEDVWYLIDDAYAREAGTSHGWRLYVPPEALQDYYGLRAPLETHVRAQGVRVELPEINVALAERTRYQMDRAPAERGAGDRMRLKRDPDGGVRAADLLGLPWVTLLLILINVGVCYYVNRSYETPLQLRMFLNQYDNAAEALTERAQWYRLLTATFLHVDINHLLSNMMVLYAVGSYLEPKMHRLAYLLIYLLSGIAGSAFSAWYHLSIGETDYAAIGASGAVYGMVGGIVAYALLHRLWSQRMLLSRVIFGVMLLVYSNTSASGVSDGIDHMGHVGGLFGGFILMGIYCLIDWRGLQMRRKRI